MLCIIYIATNPFIFELFIILFRAPHYITLFSTKYYIYINYIKYFIFSIDNSLTHFCFKYNTIYLLFHIYNDRKFFFLGTIQLYIFLNIHTFEIYLILKINTDNTFSN